MTSSIAVANEVTHGVVDKKTIPSQQAAEDRAAELFWLVTQENRDWNGNGQLTSFGDQHVSPERLNEVMAQYLTTTTSRQVSPENVALAVQMIRAEKPELILQMNKKKPPGQIGEEHYVRFGPIMGNRNSELLAAAPLTRPGEKRNITSYLTTVASQFVQRANVGTPKLK